MCPCLLLCSLPLPGSLTMTFSCLRMALGRCVTSLACRVQNLGWGAVEETHGFAGLFSWWKKTILEGSTNVCRLPGLKKILTFLLLVTHSDVKGSLSWCRYIGGELLSVRFPFFQRNQCSLSETHSLRLCLHQYQLGSGQCRGGRARSAKEPHFSFNIL